MFFCRHIILFRSQGLQGPDDAETRIARFNYIVDITH